MEKVELFEVKRNVRCCKCGSKGAVRFYGRWYPSGMGSLADAFTTISMEKYRNDPYMSHAVGPGGIIPWMCLNCGNKGMVDSGGLEGLGKAFETIRLEE